MASVAPPKGASQVTRLTDILHLRLEEIRAKIISRDAQFEDWTVRTARYLGPGNYEYLDSDRCPLREGDIWGRQGQTAFIQGTAAIPSDWVGLKVGIDLLTGGEGLLKIDGEPYHGVDDNRGYILLTQSANGGEGYRLDFEMKTGGYLEYVVSNANQSYVLSRARLVAINSDIERAYYDFRVVLDAANAIPDPTLQETILRAIKDSLATVDFRDTSAPRFGKALLGASALLREKLDAVDFADSPGKVFFCGHSHIDLAWLWPLMESERKVGRTYSTTMAMMDEFPHYNFVCSQVPLFLYLKQHFPSVYEKVKARVADGRFEPVGGTWVENDTNVVSGESLVRQCLYGQRFFRNEFGVDVRVGWLPDVFGYSWALPQVYRKAGLDYFMTAKLAVNDTNQFPHNAFWWQGVDGTKILTQIVHNLPWMYNAMVKPHELIHHWNDYKSKLTNPELLAPYGWGDGGGGPTREMLEYLPRLVDIPGIPKAITGRTHDYFDRLGIRSEGLPVWNGELYFERHRGTYTSQANNKKSNRKGELLYRDVEFLGVVNSLYGGDYPKERLTDGWHKLLLNQFHDILPGSSINEVYRVCEKDYAEVLGSGEEMRQDALGSLVDRITTDSGDATPVVVVNSLSWVRTDTVSVEVGDASEIMVIDERGIEVPSQVLDGALTFVAKDVPPCGYSVYSLVESKPAKECWFSIEGGKVTTPYYELDIQANGTITRLYDRHLEREVLPEGARANALQLFEDKSFEHAWDIYENYQDKMWTTEVESPVRILEMGPAKMVLCVANRYGSSQIEQRIVFYAHSPRIDFETEVDWQERSIMLKVAFPVEVHSTRASYDISYGTIERPTHWNTSWDATKFEVCGHKWADLSEADYGVSVLNDCKYGWDIKDNTIRLTLLRSTTYPDPEADRGRHSFTYSILPHGGDWRTGTVQSAYELNVPLLAVRTDAHAGELTPRHSFMSADRDNVIIDAVKQAEDGDETIVRVLEAYGARGPVTLTFDRPIASAVECNLLEEGDTPVDFEGSEIRFAIKPFEVRTFRVRMA